MWGRRERNGRVQNFVRIRSPYISTERKDRSVAPRRGPRQWETDRHTKRQTERKIGRKKGR